MKIIRKIKPIEWKIKREEQDNQNIPKDQVNVNDILEEESKIKIDKKMTYNETETNFVRKDEELVSNTVFGNNSKCLIREESKSSKSSNFSKYSKNSQHQILKLEKENEEKKLIKK